MFFSILKDSKNGDSVVDISDNAGESTIGIIFY